MNLRTPNISNCIIFVPRAAFAAAAPAFTKTIGSPVTTFRQFRPPDCLCDSAGLSLRFSAELSAVSLSAVRTSASPRPRKRSTESSAAISLAHGKAEMVYTIALDPTSWLATLTGESTVTVYTNDNPQEINKSALAVSDPARFNGFLFKVNGKLVLFADVQADGVGHGIGPN
jgi:hypothetical protein